MSPQVRDALFERAAATGDSASAVVREAVVKHLWPNASDDEVARLAST